LSCNRALHLVSPSVRCRLLRLIGRASFPGNAPALGTPPIACGQHAAHGEQSLTRRRLQRSPE
jgi:hypothetical protein